MGVSEIHRFADGTRIVAHALADSSAFTVVGGDTAAAGPLRARQLGASTILGRTNAGRGADRIDQGPFPERHTPLPSDLVCGPAW